MSEQATLWLKACEFEGIEPTTIGAELRADNPHRARLAELSGLILEYEHTLRYLYKLKAARDAALTGATT